MWSYSGVRPLYDDGDSDPSAITRDYVLKVDALPGDPGPERAPVLSIFGGKITTYRKLAESVLEQLAAYHPGLQPCWTRAAPLPGGDLPERSPAAWQAELARRYPQLPAELLRAVGGRYGTRATEVLGDARDMDDLGEHFGAMLTAREVDFLRAQEWARSAEDVLWRRTKCGLPMTPAQRARVAAYMDESAGMKRICLFCGAKAGTRPVYAAAAAELGREGSRRAASRWSTAAAASDLMKIAAESALAAGGAVVGVITEQLMVHEVGHPGLTELLVVPTMHERKALMAERADAFVALPGGFGTFDELCEMATWDQLGIHAKPLVLVNLEGYFDGFLAQLDRAVEDGTAATRAPDDAGDGDAGGGCVRGAGRLAGAGRRQRTAGGEAAAAVMRPLAAMPAATRRAIRGVLADIDDTLTTHGRLTATAYAALERLRAAGKLVVPDHRPAGRLVRPHRAHVAGRRGRRRERRLLHALRRDAARAADGASSRPTPSARAIGRRLADIGAMILREVPGCALASDQGYRETDLAIDFCEDVPPLPRAAVDRIVALMQREGMTAKVSSIHVNGWFGDYDKLTMTRTLFAEAFGIDLDAERAHYAVCGRLAQRCADVRVLPQCGRRGQRARLSRPHRHAACLRDRRRGRRRFRRAGAGVAGLNKVGGGVTATAAHTPGRLPACAGRQDFGADRTDLRVRRDSNCDPASGDATTPVTKISRASASVLRTRAS